MPRAPRQLLPPEQAVLLLLGGEENDEAFADALRRVTDWPAVLTLAQSERAAAELHRRVRHRAGDHPPPAVRDTLQRMAMVSEFETAQLRECLDRATATLTALDAPVMLLKGAALVPTVYGGDFTRRPMADIDVLVPASRAADVYQALITEGWTETIAPDRSAVYREHHHLPPLRDARGSRVALEIHTALFGEGHVFGLTPDLLWSHAERLSRPPAPDSMMRGPYVPAIAHQLLHVCVHFAWSHVMRFGAWRAFLDVNAIAKSGRIAWDAFVQLANETRTSTCCYWTFRLASVAARVSVPADVIQALRPARSAAVMRGLERHYVLNLLPASGACPSVRIDRALWELGMIPSASEYGTARPWDRDTHFGLPATDRAARPRVSRAGQLWRAIRYLSTIVGLTATPAAAHRPTVAAG